MSVVAGGAISLAAAVAVLAVLSRRGSRRPDLAGPDRAAVADRTPGTAQ